MGGTLREEQERSRGQSPGPLGPGSLLSSQAGSSLQSPIQAVWVLGAQEGEQGDQERQAGGVLPEEQERSRGRLPHPLGHKEPAELPDQSPRPPRPLQADWVLEGIGGRPGGDEERQAGGALQEEQERREEHFPHPLEPRKPAGLPGEVPCPLRPGVWGTPGPLLFLEPKPHPPRPFPALWVLSIGPAHHPNLALA